MNGSGVALITPFKKNKLDEDGYIYQIKRQIKYGTRICIPAGTTGESATLTHMEHMRCIEIAVETCKNTGVKVLAGAGSNSTAEAVELARFAQKCGADAILCVAPYYNKPSQEGLYQHYKTVANCVDIPLMLYNVPSRTGVEIEPETAIRLYRDVENIFGIKEADGRMQSIVHLNTHAEGLYIFSGDDFINYPILSNGGRGVISVTANLLPDYVAKLTDSALNGDMQASRSINNELYDINTALFCESNPIPIKAAMFVAGLLSSLEYRLPLIPPSKENFKLIEQTLLKYNIGI